MGVMGVLRNLPLPPGQAVGLVVGVVLDRFHPARLPGTRTVHRTAGAPLMVAGCALVVWALAERRRRTTGGFDLEQPQSLVTTGPYALSRHPMYVGWWLIHLGFGVMRGSAWTLVTLPAAILAEHRGVRAEERELAETFGPQFVSYADRVPRYVGVFRASAGYGPASSGNSMLGRYGQRSVRARATGTSTITRMPSANE